MLNYQNKLNNLQYELELSNKTNEDLQLVIRRIKEEKNYTIDDITKTKQLEIQKTKESLESKSKQQLNMLEKLIKEKKVLLLKCEEFHNKLKQAENTNVDNLNEAEMRFALELRNCRDQWAENEKQKREHFIATKTKEIKEMTIKGLEPELQRLMRKSKEELSSKEKDFNLNLIKEKERLIQSFEDKLQQQRKELISTKDNDIIKERESLSIKLKDNWDIYQVQLKDSSEKWRSTLENEKDKMDEIRTKEVNK